MDLRFFIGLILSFLLGNSSFGQQKPYISSNIHYGFVIPHHSSVVNLIQGHSKALEVDLNWNTNGDKQWHQDYNYPAVGIDFFFNMLGNKEQLGNHISAMGYVDFPIGKKKHHAFKTGVGLGYSSKIWDLENNPKDLFLSSHFNAAIHLQYSYKILLSEFIQLKTGARITHFSNGSMKLPNKGINNASVFLGLTFCNKYQTIKIIDPPQIDGFSEKRYSFSTNIVSGIKQISIADNKKYPVFAITNIIDKRISSKTSWGLGIDLFYNSGLRVLMADEQGVKSSSQQAFQVGGLISYTKHLFPWEIKIMTGAYLIDNYKLTGSIYNRFGLRYYINDHLFVGMFLKTHFARADFGELALGWRF